MKKLAIVLCFFTSLWSSQAQNPLWSFPGKFRINGLGQISNLQTNPTFPNYGGQTTTENHNIIVNSNGDLAYFIVGSKIYDARGIFIDELLYSSGNQATPLLPMNEMLVVPNTYDCNKFYIFTSSPVPMFNPAFYDLFDAQGLTQNPGSQYVGQNKGGFIYNQFCGPDPCDNMNYLWSGVSGSPSTTTPAGFYATKVRNDGKQFLFVHDGVGKVFRFRFTSSGLVYDNHFVNLATVSGLTGINYIGSYTEFEGIEIGENLIRVSGFVRSANNSVLFTLDFDVNGTYITNSVNTVTLDNVATSPTFLPHGLEFSPNGQTLYFTREKTNQSINYINFTNPQTVVAFNPSGANNYGASYIEIFDGNLFLANATGLARITNPNNPNSSNFTANFTNFGSPFSYPKCDTPHSGGSSVGAFVIPDQIDNLNYIDYFQSGNCCEVFVGNYNVTSFTASESGT